MKTVKSPNANRSAKLLPGHARAFCASAEEKQTLLDYGFEEREIFEGGQVETLDAQMIAEGRDIISDEYQF